MDRNPLAITVAVALASLITWAPSADGRSAQSAPFLAPSPLRHNTANIASASGGAARGQTRRLSNETTHSEWAYVIRRTRARTRPDSRSPILHRITHCDRFGCYTVDNTAELVLALNQVRALNGRLWVRVRLPMRPNNETGWILRSALSGFHVVTTELVIDRNRLRATLYDRGRRVWSAPVGIGKPSTPTPGGHFYIREGLRTTDPGGLYGVYAFGTSAYSRKLTDWPGGGVIGMHGTNEPSLIPGRPSHGCIRLKNKDMRRLMRRLPYYPGADEIGLGTPIRIR